MVQVGISKFIETEMGPMADGLPTGVSYNATNNVKESAITITEVFDKTWN